MPISTSSGHPLSNAGKATPSQLVMCVDGVARTQSIDSVNTVAASGSAVKLPDSTEVLISYVTLTAACTLTFPSPRAGTSFTLVLVQGGAGSYTITWPSNVKWPSGSAPTLSTAVSSVDYLVFICADNSTWAGFIVGLNIS